MYYPAPTYIVDTTSADLFPSEIKVSYTTPEEKTRYDGFVDNFARSVSTTFLRLPFDSTPIAALADSLYDVIWPPTLIQRLGRAVVGRATREQTPSFLRMALTALSGLHQSEVARIAQNALVLLQDVIAAEKRTGVVWEREINNRVSDILAEVDSKLKDKLASKFDTDDFKELVTDFATWITNNEVSDPYDAVADAYPLKKDLTKDVCVMLRLYRRSTIDAFKRRLQLTYTVSRELIVGTILDPVNVDDLSSLFSLTPGEIRARYELPFNTLLEQARHRVARGSELLKRHAARPVFDDRMHLLSMLATGITDTAEAASLEVLPMFSQLSVPTLNRFQQRVAKLYQRRLSSPRYTVLPPLSDSDIANVLSVAQTLYNETSDLSAPEYNPTLPTIPTIPDDQLKKVGDYIKQLRKWCAIKPVEAPEVDFLYGNELISLLGDVVIRDGKPIRYYLELMQNVASRYGHGVSVLTQLRSLVPDETPPDNISDEYYRFIYGIRDAIQNGRPLSNVPMWCALVRDYGHHQAILAFVEKCCAVVSKVAETDREIVLATHSHFVQLKRLSLLYGILYVSVANDLDRRISPGVIMSCLHEIDVAIRQQTKLVLSDQELNTSETKLEYYMYNPLYRMKMPEEDHFTDVAAWRDILREVSESPVKWGDYRAVVAGRGEVVSGHAASAFESDMTLHMDHGGHDFSDDEKESRCAMPAEVRDVVVVEESVPLDVRTFLPNDDEFI